jgi:hypothetical protein
VPRRGAPTVAIGVTHGKGRSPGRSTLEQSSPYRHALPVWATPSELVNYDNRGGPCSRVYTRGYFWYAPPGLRIALPLRKQVDVVSTFSCALTS